MTAPFTPPGLTRGRRLQDRSLCGSDSLDGVSRKRRSLAAVAGSPGLASPSGGGMTFDGHWRSPNVTYGFGRRSPRVFTA